MALLKFPNDQPAGGWQFIQADTALRLTSDSLTALADLVVAHRKHKGLTPTDKASVLLEIQRKICTRLTTKECRSEGPSDPWHPLQSLTETITLSAVLNASRAFFTWLTSGKPMVDITENERRRQICITCPLNDVMSGCRCSVFYKAIAAAVPQERQYADLHVCLACKCSLKAKCATPAELIALTEKGRGIQYPVHCWVPGTVKQIEDQG